MPNVTVAGTVSVTVTLNVLAEYENEKLVSAWSGTREKTRENLSRRRGQNTLVKVLSKRVKLRKSVSACGARVVRFVRVKCSVKLCC